MSSVLLLRQRSKADIRSASIFTELHVRYSPISVHITYVRGSVMLWRRCDMLCTSGFMDDVTFCA